MAVQSDAGTSRANPRFEQAGVRWLEVHREPSGPIRGAAPVGIAAEVTDGGRVATDDARSGRTGVDREVGDDGIA